MGGGGRHWEASPHAGKAARGEAPPGGLAQGEELVLLEGAARRPSRGGGATRARMQRSFLSLVSEGAGAKL